MKNTVDGIKNRLDETEDWISELEDKVEKNSQTEQWNEKRLKKNEEGLRELQDNMKHNNICIIGIPGGKEEEQGIGNQFEKVIMENSLIWWEKKSHTSRKHRESQSRGTQRGLLQDTS